MKRLLLHCGLHKTGTTSLQTFLNGRVSALAEGGLHWPYQDGYPAHHPLAHALLRGDATPFVAALQGAADLDRAAISSEDLSWALHDPETARFIEAVAGDAGWEVTWLFVLRDPVEAFFSTIAMLSRHQVYVDLLSAFDEVMRSGRLLLIDPKPGQDAVPNWCFFFDHPTVLRGFREAVAGAVVVEEYANSTPIPGLTYILEHWVSAASRPALTAELAAGEALRLNPRLPPAKAGQRRADIMARWVPGTPTMTDVVTRRTADEATLRPFLGAALATRFADHRDVFEEGCAAPRARSAAVA